MILPSCRIAILKCSKLASQKMVVAAQPGLPVIEFDVRGLSTSVIMQEKGVDVLVFQSLG
jgi:hypothetical protein